MELHQFKPGRGVPNFSPFCMKVAILLKMADIDFDEVIISDPSKAPKGKLPYIIDGNHTIADSTLIKNYLENNYKVDFDAGLNAEQKAISHAYTKMIEDRFYWVIVHSRWIDEKNWPSVKDFWFCSLPPIVRNIVPIIAQKQVRTRIKAHGLGDHDVNDIYAFGTQDLSAMSVQLGDKDFMFGDNPTSLDATAYPMIANALLKEFQGPLLDSASQFENFGPYVERCQKLWFE